MNGLEHSGLTPRQTLRRLFWPLALIAVGVVFLLQNLGVLQWPAAWSLFDLWPLILIVIGVDGLLDREGAAGAAVTAGLGAAFLLGNFGFLQIDTWQVIFTVWPIFLMAWGVDVMIGRRSWAAELLGAAAMLVVLAAAIGLLSGGLVFPGASGRMLETRHDFAGAETGRLSFELPVGVLDLSAGEAGSELIAARPASAKEPDETFTHGSGSAAYEWRATPPKKGFSFPMFSSGPAWEFRLPTQTPLEITVNQGVAASSLDLAGLMLASLDADFGVGRMKIVLPAADANVHLSGGVGFWTIVVPQGAGVRIRRDTGMAFFSVPPGYQRVDGDYVSPGYEDSEVRLEIEIDQGVGGVVFEVR